jgi:hypothetical protein
VTFFVIARRPEADEAIPDVKGGGEVLYARMR